ncbi:transporter [Cryptosporidium ryanae]|uniref:transporter n=1 Tax=Cryptosporidium ryanae TaxID=515981 RepID=UPI00351A042F|nr:transporter [Cryptosporidium ryanae]
MSSLNDSENIDLSAIKRSSRRSSFPTLQGLYISFFEGEITNEVLDCTTNIHSKKIDPKALRIIFITTIFISIVLCLDHGFVACNLKNIEMSFGIGYAQSSFIGSMVYFGFLIGCLITGLFLPIIKSKFLIVSSLTIVMLSAIYSSKADFLSEIYASRFFCGFFQSLPIIYLPLWVEKYSPKANTIVWLAYQQLCSMLGIFFGYLIGGIFTCFTVNEINTIFYASMSEKILSVLLSWRGPFLLQAILILPIIVVLIFIPGEFLDVGNEEDFREYENLKTTGLLVSGTNIQRSTNKGITFEGNTKSRTNKLKRSSILLLPYQQEGINSTKREDIMEVLTNPIFLFTTIAICGVYCVTTCTIFWLNQYLTEIISIDRFSSIFSVACVYLVGPTTGVYFGGVIGDLLIESYPDGLGWLLTVCTTSSFFALITSMAIEKTKSYILFMWGMTFLLFFLTSTLPISLIIIIKCVSFKTRQLASAIAQFLFNFIGFLISPVIIGLLMDIIEYFPFGALKKKYNPIRIGMKAILYFTIPILFFYSLSTILCYCNCLMLQRKYEKKILITNQDALPKQVIIE